MNRTLCIGAFTLGLSAAAANASLVGLWEFDNPSNLGKATVGNDMTVSNQNGTIVAFNDPLVGSAARVGFNDHFVLAHGIPPNGGGEHVNEYTIVWDVLVPTRRSGDNADISARWRSFLNSGFADSNAHFWLNPSDNRLGHQPMGGAFNGYTPLGVDLDTWYRIVFSRGDVSDTSSFRVTMLNTSGSVVFSYDGFGIVDVDDRHALREQIRFFYTAGSEAEEMWVATIALYDEVLSAAEAMALGAPGSTIAIPEPASLALMGGACLLMLRRRHRA